jgi:hypothetical protein
MGAAGCNKDTSVATECQSARDANTTLSSTTERVVCYASVDTSVRVVSYSVHRPRHSREPRRFNGSRLLLQLREGESADVVHVRSTRFSLLVHSTRLS